MRNILCLSDISEKRAKLGYLMVSIGFLNVLKPVISPTMYHLAEPAITAIDQRISSALIFSFLYTYLKRIFYVNHRIYPKDIITLPLARHF